MQAYVGITDYEWYQLLASRPQLDEVNFWQPGGSRGFRALQPGELFLFKLHAPRHSIVGGGFGQSATGNAGALMGAYPSFVTVSTISGRYLRTCSRSLSFSFSLRTGDLLIPPLH